MATYSRNKNAVFYHIPKCAGLYIDSILSEEDDFITYNFNIKSPIRFYWSSEVGIREEFNEKCQKFLIDPETMKECFEFTFIRNPYTRFVSAYFYSKSCETDEPGIMDTIQSAIDNINRVSYTTYLHLFKTQWKNIEYNKKEIDYIGRFENLHSDLKEIFKKLGLPLNYNKSKVNENPIRYGNYKQYITQTILEFINSHFDEDFQRFNYQKVTRIENLP